MGEFRIRRAVIALALAGVFIGASILSILLVSPVADAGIDQIVDVGESVQFDGSNSQNAAQYWWNFRDNGWSNSTVNPTHIYQTEGIYDVGLIVIASNGRQSLDTIRITVTNSPPIVDAGEDVDVKEDETIAFDGSGTTDSIIDFPILMYEWNFGDGYNATGMSAQHAYSQAGIYEAVLSVIDDQGAIGRDSRTVTVINEEPTVAISNAVADEGNALIVSASGSDTISDQANLRYEWDNGKFGEKTTYTYDDDGIYHPQVTVRDNDGAMTTGIGDIEVRNVAPITGIISATVKADITLRATGEKWHDLQLYVYSDNVQSEHLSVYRMPGNPYEQEATISGVVFNLVSNCQIIVYYTPEDDPINGQVQGATPAWIMLTFEDGTEVINNNFNVNQQDTWIWSFNPTAYLINHDIEFEAYAFDPGFDDITTTWDFGDGTVITNPHQATNIPAFITETISHSYASEGIYTLSLQATDDDGGCGEFSSTIDMGALCSSVTNLAPQVSIAAQTPIAYEEDDISLSAHANAINPNSIEYCWFFGDGTTSSNLAKVTHAYGYAGTYLVYVIAEDDQDAIGLAYTIVKIDNREPSATISGESNWNEDQLVTFDGSSSSDTTNDERYLTYLWDFGDGSVAIGKEVSHVFRLSGEFNVNMTVVDNDGALGSSTMSIEISSVSPIAILSDKIVYGPQIALVLNGIGDDTYSDVTSLSYRWEFGDGQEMAGQTVSHTYGQPGSYNIVLIVTDPHGLTANARATVFVAIDSDGDSLPDEMENAVYGTDSELEDTDGDDIIDYWEIFNYGTNPTEADSDNDNATDWYEIAYFGYNMDTDNDGLVNPWDPDSDDDGILDGDDSDPLQFNGPDGRAYPILERIVNLQDSGFNVTVAIDYVGDPGEDYLPNIALSQNPGVSPGGIGPVFQITTPSQTPFIACIIITYPDSAVSGVTEDSLSLYKREYGSTWGILNNTGAISSENKAWGVTYSFSNFQIADASAVDSDNDGTPDAIDVNPLLNMKIKVNIEEIVGLDPDVDWANRPSFPFGSPNSAIVTNFYCIVTVNGQSSLSPDFVVNGIQVFPNWVSKWDVPDNQRYVSIGLSLWYQTNGNYPNHPNVVMCDISRDMHGGTDAAADCNDIEMTYDIVLGELIQYKLELPNEIKPENDDYDGDGNGVGHVSGEEDGSTETYLSENQNDCELWFEVIQNTMNDIDNDGIENSLDIDPLIDLEVTFTPIEIIGYYKSDSFPATPSWDLKSYHFEVSVNGGSTIVSPLFKDEETYGSTSDVFPNWACVFDVPDDQRYVAISVALYDDKTGICDISGDDGGGRGPNYNPTPVGCSDAELTFDLVEGRLTRLNPANTIEDDWEGDSSGAGFVSGLEDGCTDNRHRAENDAALVYIVSYNGVPFRIDSDNDRLDDYTETNILFTDPNNKDTDGDGLEDGDEMDPSYFRENHGHTDPLKKDTDGDGINDGDEVNNYYDHDDPREFIPHYTDPLDPDTDDDGFDDGYEVDHGTSPVIHRFLYKPNAYVDVASSEYIPGNPVYYYVSWYCLFVNPSSTNPTVKIMLDNNLILPTYYTRNGSIGSYTTFDEDDEDLITIGNHILTVYYAIDWDASTYDYIYSIKIDSFTVSSGPMGDDDGDMMPNGWEVANSLNPFSAADKYLDPDGDSLENYLECRYRTNPNVANTDSDSAEDGHDIDPLSDLSMTISIEGIKYLDSVPSYPSFDFYWVIEITDLRSGIAQSITSTSYECNGNYIYPLSWTITYEIDDQLIGSLDWYLGMNWKIKISLFSIDDQGNVQACDIANTGTSTILYFDVLTGDWAGSDYHSDSNGYGTVSGDEDGSTQSDENDCYMLFDIWLNKGVLEDNDPFTFWEEVTKYHIDPTVDDSLGDWDGDGIPNGYEKLHGLTSDDAIDALQDLDGDGIPNIWEYQLRNNGKSPDNPLDTYGINLYVSFEGPMEVQLREDIIETVRDASDILFAVTGGYFLIDEAHIGGEKQYWDSPGSIQIHNTVSWVWNTEHWPQANGRGTDQGVTMPYAFDGSGDGDGISMEQIDTWVGDMAYSRTLAHELCHARLSLGDEYIGYYWIGPFVFSYTIDWNLRLHSFMAKTSATKLSTAYDYAHPLDGDHTHDTSTLQMFNNGESCWETIFDNYHCFSGIIADRDGGIQFDLNNDGNIDPSYPNDYVQNDSGFWSTDPTTGGLIVSHTVGDYATIY